MKTITTKTFRDAGASPGVVEFYQTAGGGVQGATAEELLARAAKIVNLRYNYPEQTLAEIGAGLEFMLQKGMTDLDGIGEHYVDRRNSPILLPEMTEDMYMHYLSENNLVGDQIRKCVQLLDDVEAQDYGRVKDRVESSLLAIAEHNPDEVMSALSEKRSERGSVRLFDMVWLLFDRAWRKERPQKDALQDMSRYFAWFFDGENTGKASNFLINVEESASTSGEMGRILALFEMHRERFDGMLGRVRKNALVPVLLGLAARHVSGSAGGADGGAFDAWMNVLVWAGEGALESVNLLRVAEDHIFNNWRPYCKAGEKDFLIRAVLAIAKLKNVARLTVFAENMPDFIGAGRHFNFRCRESHPDEKCPSWDFWKFLDIRGIETRARAWYLNGLLGGSGDFAADVMQRCADARLSPPEFTGKDVSVPFLASSADLFYEGACFTHVCPGIAIELLNGIALKALRDEENADASKWAAPVLERMAKAAERSFCRAGKDIRAGVKRLARGRAAFSVLPGTAMVSDNPLFNLVNAHDALSTPMKHFQLEGLASGDNLGMTSDLVRRHGIAPDLWHDRKIPKWLLEGRCRLESMLFIWMYLCGENRMAEARRMSPVFWRAFRGGGFSVVDAMVGAQPDMVLGWLKDDWSAARELCARNRHAKTAGVVRSLIKSGAEETFSLSLGDSSHRGVLLPEDLDAAMFDRTPWNLAVAYLNAVRHVFAADGDRQKKAMVYVRSARKRGFKLSAGEQERLLRECLSHCPGLLTGGEMARACFPEGFPALLPRCAEGSGAAALRSESPAAYGKFFSDHGAALDWTTTTFENSAGFWESLPADKPNAETADFIKSVFRGMLELEKERDLQRICLLASESEKPWLLSLALESGVKLTPGGFRQLRRRHPLPREGWESALGVREVSDLLLRAGY